MPSSSLRRTGRLCGLAAAAFLLFQCGGRAAHLELRIGFLFPKSGPFAPYALPLLRGARLAVTEANRDGDIVLKGRRYTVVLVEKDSGNGPEPALAAAQELINRDGAAAIVGPVLSGQAIPVARLADRAGIPMVVQLATNPEVTRGTRSVFRVCYTDDFQGQAMARFALEKLRARRAAILYNVADEYSSGIAGIFSREIAARGGRVVASETYTTGAADFRPQLSRIKAAHPDMIFLPNYSNEIRPQVGQIHELAMNVPIVGGDGMGYSNPEYMAAIEGAWYAAHFSAESPGPKAAKFLASYREAYAHEPDQIAALSYDAVSLLVEAARARRSAEPAEIIEALRGLDVFEGVTGTMIFRGSPDPRMGVVVVRVKDGNPRFEARIEP
jgi:branched-chain amino acid transport system substrate-binding protein